MVSRMSDQFIERLDMRLLQTRFQRIGFLVLLAFALAFPLYAGYWTSVMNMALIFAIAALGLTIVTGLAGQLSVGQAAMMGFGGVTTYVLVVVYSFPHLLALALAALIVVGLGAIIGLPALRIGGLYVAIITYSLQLIFDWFFINVFGGVHITANFPTLSIGIMKVNTELKWYYFLLILTALLMWFAGNLRRSHIGRAFIAIRDHEIAANILGVNILKYKVVAFGLSGFFGALAGGLWGFYNLHIIPEHFTIWQSIWFLAIIMIGGLGSVWGALLGSILLTFLLETLRFIIPEVMRYLPIEAYTVFAIRWIIVGAFLLLIILYEPKGLVSLLQRLKDRYIDQWPFPRWVS